MQHTLHKDGTVSVRMTLDELDDIASGTFYGWQKWSDKHRDSGMSVDQRIANSYYNTHLATSAVVASVRRRPGVR